MTRVSRQPLGRRQCSAALSSCSSSVLVLAFVIVLGCSKSPDQAKAQAPTNSWRNAPFYVLQTELSPAILVFSTNKYLSLFTGLDEYGLGAPSYLAFATRDGPRAFTNGARVVADHMEESWLLVWFTGAKGWTNQDVPWAMFLERKPASMKLDAGGMHLGFRRGAEHVLMVPLYGSKPQVATSKWPQFLPKEVLMRIRYWAGAVRHLPIFASCSIGSGNDTVTLRYEFDWLSTRDDWNTKTVKLAPMPPSIALSVTNKQSPIQSSAAVIDLKYITPVGPYKAIQDTDRYVIQLPLTHFTNQNCTNWSFNVTSVYADSNAWPGLAWPASQTFFGHISPGMTNSPHFRTNRLDANTHILLLE